MRILYRTNYGFFNLPIYPKFDGVKYLHRRINANEQTVHIIGFHPEGIYVIVMRTMPATEKDEKVIASC